MTVDWKSPLLCNCRLLNTENLLRNIPDSGSKRVTWRSQIRQLQLHPRVAGRRCRPFPSQFRILKCRPCPQAQTQTKANCHVNKYAFHWTPKTRGNNFSQKLTKLAGFFILNNSNNLKKGTFQYWLNLDRILALHTYITCPWIQKPASANSKKKPTFITKTFWEL